MRGIFGDGSALVIVKTFSGSVVLARAQKPERPEKAERPEKREKASADAGTAERPEPEA